MATAPSLADKINKDFLKCGICLEAFKKPRGLPCLHSFCEECLERWAAKSKKKGKSKEFACPNCMKLTRIPAEGIQGFPAHFLVNSLQETVNMEKKAEACAQKLCTKCKKPEAKVVVYCSDCDQFFCKTCYQSDDSHSPWGAMKHHRVISIEDLEAGKVSVPEQTATSEQYCAEHEEEQCKFYCKTCGKLVCRDCIIMKQRCRDHDYVTMKEASSERSSEVKKMMKKCSKGIKSRQKFLEKLEVAKSKLAESVARVKTELDQGEKEYIEEVRKAYAQQARRVDERYKYKEEYIKDYKDGVIHTIQELDEAYQQGKSFLETTSHSQIISQFPAAQTKLQDILWKCTIRDDDDDDDDDEDDDEDEDSGNDTCDKLGKITKPSTTMHLGPQWEQCRDIKVPNTVSSNHGPKGIALTSENKIVIQYYDSAKVFSSSGEEEYCFGSLEHVAGVAVDSKDRIILTFNCSGLYDTMRVYNKKFKCIKKCTLLCSSAFVAEVTVDTNDNAVVGTEGGDKISVYNINSGSEITSFGVHGWPVSLAVCVPGEINVCFLHTQYPINLEDDSYTLETVDYSGKTIETFREPPEVVEWCPNSVCASKRQEVFVVNAGDPKAIYRYTSHGDYIGCVTTEIKHARGIAISHDDQKLYVTEGEDQVVKVFKRPQIHESRYIF